MYTLPGKQEGNNRTTIYSKTIEAFNADLYYRLCGTKMSIFEYNNTGVMNRQKKHKCIILGGFHVNNSP